MAALINCKDLTKGYAEKQVLSEQSFSLLAGEALLVTGANGSGKTTLLSILAGLVACEGEIQLHGHHFSPATHDLRRHIGFSPAGETSLFLNASVRQNLEFWLRLHSLPSATARISVLADQWGFSSYLESATYKLSSGFRRRVALARVFLHDPTLVLLDEPFAFLDNEGQKQLAEVLEQWLERRQGALIVSSNVEFTRGSKWKSLHLRSTSNRDSPQ